MQKLQTGISDDTVFGDENEVACRRCTRCDFYFYSAIGNFDSPVGLLGGASILVNGSFFDFRKGDVRVDC